MKPSHRSQVESFRVMDVLDRANALAREGRTVYHLEVGQPSSKAPQLALDAAQRALSEQVLGYTEALGRPQLRERISKHYRDFYGVDVAPGRVVVTTGSSAGFVLAFLTLFDVGQSLAIANPGYPAYRNITRALGIKPRLIDCREPEQFRLTASTLAAEQDIEGVLIASPSNPCGTLVSADELARIAGLCTERGLRLISDEIYHGITYGTDAQTMLAYSPDVVVINSFSKYFSMTGWRIGWMVVPEWIVATVERLAQNFYISAPAISQVAAFHALDAARELDGHVQSYAANRKLLMQTLRCAGFGAMAPADGAFYLYADVSPFGLESSVFTSRLLEEAGVAATPGIDFDPDDGGRWVRFSYASSHADVERAAAAISRWCGTLKRG